MATLPATDPSVAGSVVVMLAVIGFFVTMALLAAGAAGAAGAADTTHIAQVSLI